MGSFRKIPAIREKYRKLFDADVMLWWFAADWAVARRNFEQRRYPMCKYFDIQIRKVEAALPEINALFRSHVEYALPPPRACSTPSQTPPESDRPTPLRIQPPIYERREAPVIHL